MYCPARDEFFWLGSTVVSHLDLLAVGIDPCMMCLPLSTESAAKFGFANIVVPSDPGHIKLSGAAGTSGACASSHLPN